MRALRANAGVSLRQAETRSGWGRGTLSQVENGKARPSRALVEWYETAFDADGLLLSAYAEARGAHRTERRVELPPHLTEGDDFQCANPLLPSGALVRAGRIVTLGWTLRNTGTVAWVDRRLRRVGTHAAAQLLTSPPAVDLDDCPPGGAVDARVEVTTPSTPGTLAAYWQIVDAEGRPCFPISHVLCSVLVVR